MTPALAEERPATAAYDGQFEHLALEQLVESPLNPRKTFDEAKLQDLAASIASHGVVEPLVVRPVGDDITFEIVCGARRRRAALAAGLSHLPVLIRHYTDAQAMEIMAIENGQRDDVPPLEEAAGYKQLLVIDQTYTASRIAERIGHAERYVWDRMRLLELVPEIQDHLREGRIGVEHAEILAKLTPAEQKRAAAVPAGGLFEHDYALAFDDDPKTAKQLKVRSVRQLREWIANHIRFDPKKAAAAAPLDFGQAAQRVEAAEAEPGRGKKVVPITFALMCPQGAKDDTERTYGASAWKKAEGKDGTGTCDHAVLGVVVAGEHYGDTFHVCTARDKCETHWKKEIAARKQNEKLRASGKTKQADKREAKQKETYNQKWQREERERKARQAAWRVVEPAIVAEAVGQVITATALAPKVAAALLADQIHLNADAIKTHLGADWFKSPVAALLVSAVATFHFQPWNNQDSGFDQFVREVAKPYGLDLKRLSTILTAHTPEKADDATSTKKAKPAKKGGKKR